MSILKNLPPAKPTDEPKPITEVPPGGFLSLLSKPPVPTDDQLKEALNKALDARDSDSCMRVMGIVQPERCESARAEYESLLQRTIDPLETHKRVLAEVQAERKAQADRKKAEDEQKYQERIAREREEAARLEAERPERERLERERQQADLERRIAEFEQRREQERAERRARHSWRRNACEVPDSTEFLIDGVLAKGQFTMLVGASNARKTLTSISWASAIAAGKPWLGHKTHKARVLVVLLEGSRVEPFRWARQLAAGLGVDPESLEGERDFYPDTLKVDDEASFNAFCEAIGDYDLVIVDNLSQIHNGGATSENDARAMYAVLHPLEQEVRSRKSLTVVVLAHANAAGEVRGRDGIKQHFDRVLTIEASSDRNDAVITLERGKARDGYESNDELRWRFVGGPDDEAITMEPIVKRAARVETEEDIDPRRVQLLALLPARAEEIHKGMGGKNRNATNRLRDQLEADGTIMCVDGVWSCVEGSSTE